MLTGLVRFCISLVMLTTFIWFAVTVPLGKRTLWGHLHAIFATQEAKDLAEGTKEEAEKVAHKVQGGAASGGHGATLPSPAPVRQACRRRCRRR